MTGTGQTPLVSVVVPARGEAERIGRCLGAILGQDWPVDRLEILVVDGGPGDGIAEVASAVLARHPGVRSAVLANPGGTRSGNLNRGLRAATGDIVCRVDARSLIPPYYVRRCVDRLADPSIAAVGGSQHSIAPSADWRGTGIARALNNRLAMGMARYRRGGPSGPTDTVYLGAFRARDLRELGGWAEDLDVNEDFDLNRRMARLGTVWFESTLVVDYLPRESLARIARQYFGFGRWKVGYLRERGESPRARQVVALAVVPGSVAVASVIAGSRSRVALLVASGALALLLEQAGNSERTAQSPVRSRLWSIGTCAAVVGSWSVGAWFELLAGPLRRR